MKADYLKISLEKAKWRYLWQCPNLRETLQDDMEHTSSEANIIVTIMQSNKYNMSAMKQQRSCRGCTLYNVHCTVYILSLMIAMKQYQL